MLPKKRARWAIRSPRSSENEEAEVIEKILVIRKVNTKKEMRLERIMRVTSFGGGGGGGAVRAALVKAARGGGPGNTCGESWSRAGIETLSTIWVGLGLKIGPNLRE